MKSPQIRICGDEWMDIKKLGEICTIVSGGTPSRTNTEFWDGGTIPWIKIGDIKEKHVSKADEYITQAGLDGSSAKMLSKGTILYTIFATLGEAGILTIDACTNQAIAGITIKNQDEVLADYLYYYLKSKKSYVNNLGRGVAQNNINLSILRNLKVPLPALPTQRQTVDILDKTAKVIEYRQQQLQKLDDLVKARFVELFGSCPSMASMDELCSIITDGTHQPPKFYTDGIPFIFVSNLVKNTVTYNAEKFISEETYSELYKRTPIEVGDLLLSTVGSYGHPAVVVEDRKFLFQRHIAYLKPKRDIVNSFYLHAALLSPDSQRQIEEKVKGIAQKTLNLSEIKKILIPLPSIEEQNAFEVFVKQTDKSKAVIQKALDEAQLLFDSLMQKYFG